MNRNTRVPKLTVASSCVIKQGHKTSSSVTKLHAELVNVSELNYSQTVMVKNTNATKRTMEPLISFPLQKVLFRHFYCLEA
jgi:hypothetical protein